MFFCAVGIIYVYAELKLKKFQGMINILTMASTPGSCGTPLLQRASLGRGETVRSPFRRVGVHSRPGLMPVRSCPPESGTYRCRVGFTGQTKKPSDIKQKVFLMKTASEGRSRGFPFRFPRSRTNAAEGVFRSCPALITYARHGAWKRCPWDNFPGFRGSFCRLRLSAAPSGSGRLRHRSRAATDRPHSRRGRPCPR